MFRNSFSGMTKSYRSRCNGTKSKTADRGYGTHADACVGQAGLDP